MSATQPTSPDFAAEAPVVVQPTAQPAAAATEVSPKVVRVRAKKVAQPKPAAKAAKASTAVSKVASGRVTAKTAKALAAVTADLATTKPEKLLKEKKPKLVRDSFTIPKLEYLLLDQLKQRGAALGVAVKKSELIRAGIKALAEMSDAVLLAAIKAVPTIKTGRPLKD